MASVAELLELLYGARKTVRSARGVVLYRQSRSRMQRALRREKERQPGGGRSVQIAFAFRGGTDEEPPDLYEEAQRFWWEPPDRLREETESPSSGRSHTTVRDGELWWIYSPESGAISNVDLDDDERARHGAGGGDRLRPLLDPSPLLALVEFGAIDEEGGRLRVRATPRLDLDQIPWRFHGLAGADEIELEVDRATGIVWSMRTLLDGEEIWSTALADLIVNEPLPADTFVFVPPPGVEVLPPETSGRRRRYTLEEAAQEAGFAVFFVPELREGTWRLHVNVRPARGRPPTTPAHVWLVYSRADGRAGFSLAQQPVGGGFGWPGYGPPALEEVERDGRVYTTSRPDPEQGGQSAVAFERDGTALQLQSGELDVEALLRLAASVEPVRPA